MNRKHIMKAAEAMLEAAPHKKIILVGDFCLDVYFHIDSSDGEASLETGLTVRRVNTLRDSPGGAGNVFANLRALGAGSIVATGVIGPDMFGGEMRRLLSGAGDSALIIQEQGWTTPAYMKPIIDGKEGERIDTGLRNRVSEESVDTLLRSVEAALKTADVVMINQQLEDTIYSERFIAGLNALAAAHPEIPFIVDSRGLQDRFHGMWHKLNTHEAAALAGITLDPMHSDLPLDEVQDLMRRFYKVTGDKLIVSRGEKGAAAFDGRDFCSADGISLMTELDTVGAGDSFFSGFALSLAAGLDVEEALNIGNAVAGVTVQKLHQTGTCTPGELRDIIASCDYNYNPDAVLTRIESPFTMDVVGKFEDIEARPAIEYAVFDHDGTISVLREGWEVVMEACMIDAITGGKDCDDIERIRTRCREFITKSTGIQTIQQMAMLVDIVRREGLVPEEKILDAKRYKAIYNDALMAHIEQRLRDVSEGRTPVEDATIAGSVKLLRILSEAGVKIWLASGTDIDDVKHEASLLGYAECFTGGIFGSVGDMKNDPKRQVLRNILATEGVDMHKTVIFGDGPVEMREARENGALAFGVLSDEKRRSGWNEAKRKRLVGAGADILVPDFSQYEQIAQFLLKK